MLRRAAMRLHFWLDDHERQLDRGLARAAGVGAVLRTLARLLP